MAMDCGGVLFCFSRDVFWSELYLFYLAGILFMPNEKIRKFLLEKAKIKTWLACTLAGVLFCVGAGMMPNMQTDNTVDTGYSSSRISSSSVVDDEDSSSRTQSSSKESSKTSSGKDSAPPDDDSSVSSGGSSNNSSSKNSSHVNSSQGGTKPVTVTYVLNTSTKKIHKQSCYLVAQMSDKNKKMTTRSLEALFSQGYTTCAKCF